MQAAMEAAFREYHSRWFKFLHSHLPRLKVQQAESFERLCLKADTMLSQEVME